MGPFGVGAFQFRFMIGGRGGGRGGVYSRTIDKSVSVARAYPLRTCCAVLKSRGRTSEREKTGEARPPRTRCT